MQAKDILINLGDSSFLSDSTVQLIDTGNEVHLRLAHWQPTNGVECKGTILIVQGYSEFIEKYEEVISEFRDKGYAVVAYDSRGQGLSTRFLKDFHRGYVDSYSSMINDLQQVYNEVVSSMPRPHILLAHSMGGNVSMRFLQEKKAVFDHAFLSAPMLAWNEPVGVVNMLASALVFFGKGESYAIGSGPPNSDIKAAISQRLSSDKNRINKVASYCAQESRLWMGGPTWKWVKEASKSILIAVKKENCLKVTTPTTILSPSKDIVISGANHKTLASYNENIECIVFDGAKHEILIEEDEHRIKFWKTFHKIFAE